MCTTNEYMYVNFFRTIQQRNTNSTYCQIYRHCSTELINDVKNDSETGKTSNIVHCAKFRPVMLLSSNNSVSI